MAIGENLLISDADKPSQMFRGFLPLSGNQSTLDSKILYNKTEIAQMQASAKYLK